jgi:hypothetical protein
MPRVRGDIGLKRLHLYQNVSQFPATLLMHQHGWKQDKRRNLCQPRFPRRRLMRRKFDSGRRKIRCRTAYHRVSHASLPQLTAQPEKCGAVYPLIDDGQRQFAIVMKFVSEIPTPARRDAPAAVAAVHARKSTAELAVSLMNNHPLTWRGLSVTNVKRGSFVQIQRDQHYAEGRETCDSHGLRSDAD